MKEKRKHPRVHFGFRIEAASGQKAWMTEDISVGGCFLKTLEEAAIGTKIELVFQIPGAPRYIEVTGEVKHVREKNGVGIEFIAMDNAGKEAIEGFVRDYIKYE